MQCKYNTFILFPLNILITKIWNYIIKDDYN